ncbi:putative RNA-directed DNA polymerase from mobile element jockey-like [Apostichopus japonicus]|uniref:Putative RNA-directed DNA polymerase from mobile element jockey-like n=1 Tax=Stichopus japonicus TaxID=307972 RepID=A0A2G8JSI5_STIJA|nr:putative RNA-directed DNA polymerase from mobile element jockey-like [Apostichopus japonicus]
MARKLRSVNLVAFAEEIRESLPDIRSIDLRDATDLYHSILTKVLDKHAPMREKGVTVRASHPWFTDDLYAAKCEKRKAERKWRQTKLTVHRYIFLAFSLLQCQSRGAHANPKVLQHMYNEILSSKADAKLPTYSEAKDLANKFMSFSLKKWRISGPFYLSHSNVELNPVIYFAPRWVRYQVTAHCRVYNHLVMKSTLYLSAYKPHHSTETALLRVQNDIQCMLDGGGIVILVLLDLSAAFDTVDHDVLCRMRNRLCINAGVDVKTSGATVRNLGVLFDPQLSIKPFVYSVVKSGYFNLRNIALARRQLSKSATRSITQALVTSRLDYGNSLLYGITNELMNKLEMLQNNAARLVAKTPKRTRKLHCT